MLSVSETRAGEKVYWSDFGTKTIQRSSRDGSNRETVYTSSNRIGGIDLNLSEGKIYWVETINSDVSYDIGLIRKSSLDGSSVQTIVTTNFTSEGLSSVPRDIVVDPSNQFIYWTDNTDFGHLGRIYRSDLDGSDVQLIYQDFKPDAIEIDIYNGKLYWVDNVDREILRMNLDGSNFELVSSTSARPFGLAIDPVAGHIYYSNVNTELSPFSEITRVGFDGLNHVVITTVNEDVRDVEVDSVEGKIYWANLGGTSIQRANLDGTSIETLIQTGLIYPSRVALDITDALTVITPTATSIAATGATLGGNVTSEGASTITERGVVYSTTATNADPVIGGTGVTKVTVSGTTGAFTTAVTGLTPATSYSFKAYATNAQGTSYTDVATFATLALPPSVASPSATTITATSTTLGGNVTDDGGAAVTERGVVYSPTATNSNPFIGSAGVIQATATGTTGVFSVPITGLDPGTSYHFKAYATNSVGTAYSSVSSLLTLSNNANLSGLILDEFSVSPSFSAATTTYAATVQRSDETVRIRPSAGHSSASLFARVNGGDWVAVGSGALSVPLTLEFGENFVEVRVVAQDGTTEKTYSLEVFRINPRPDAMVGISLAFMGGASVYESPIAQQLKLVSRKARRVSGYASAANRGNLSDRVALRGSGDTRFFKVDYRDSSGALVTASVRSGLYQTPELKPGDPADWLQVKVTPVKKLIVGKKGKKIVTLRKVHIAIINASSVLDPSVGDGVSIRVETR